ncbi:MAG: hypothetical protein ACLQU4_07450, partial [Limisphaerales bacterium]
MTTSPEQPGRDTKPPKPVRDASLSPDGKWRSFPKVPNLVQYVSTGTYFGRVKIKGKVFRESLNTSVFTSAKLRLGDFIKKKVKRSDRPVTGTVAEARVLYETEMNGDHTIKETSKIYRRKCIRALIRSWPGLEEMRPDKITETDCREWAARFAANYSVSVFNNTLSTLRMILTHAGLGQLAGGQAPFLHQRGQDARTGAGIAASAATVAEDRSGGDRSQR